MCGIFAYISNNVCVKDVLQYFLKIQHRGPEASVITKINDNCIFGFHRLAINDTNSNASSPFYYKNYILMCNGEIYNHEDLKKTYYIKTNTGCDCEVIAPLINILGFKEALGKLDGVFVIILYDIENKVMKIARDRYGVRPLYVAIKNDATAFASEAKALSDFDNIIEFPPYNYCVWNTKTSYTKSKIESYEISLNFIERLTMKTYYNNNIEGINYFLTSAVFKRFNTTERPVAFLLSGGLDSSLVCSIASRINNKPIHTFSIGMNGSTDLEYANLVAKYLKTEHTSIELTVYDFISVIEKVIYTIGSYDVTTVRASVGNYLIGKYISENTNFKVVFNGDGSDELFGGYLYFKNSPSKKESVKEVDRLLKDIHLYDVKRSEMCMSAHGLESRTPFLDINLINYVKSLTPEKRFPPEVNEKYILRKAFENNYLPKKVLWRRKEAFSDGVSDQNNSWFKTIHEFLKGGIEEEKKYYKNIFSKYYKNHENLIPYYWMPKWSNTNDPSARTLEGYTV